MLVEDVKQTIRDFIIGNFFFGNPPEAFRDNASFLDRGLIDSTGILELIEFIEATYDIGVAEDELTPENLDSVDRVSAFVIRKVS